MQTAAFYPLQFVLLLFRPNLYGLLSAEQYNCYFVGTHVLAALFMFAFIRELKLSRFAAFVSGFCFSCAGFLGSASWPHMLHSAIWLPLIALFLMRAMHSVGTRALVKNSLLSGFFLGLSVLAGGLHVVIAQAIFVGSKLVYCGFTEERSASRWARIAKIGTLIFCAGLGLGAIQLLPSHLYSQHSLRWVGVTAFPSNVKIPYMYTTPNAITPNALMSFLFPFFEGIGMGETWTPYIGVLPFLLTVLAVAKRWSDLRVRFLLGLAFAVFLYSLAGASALHGILYVVTPYLWLAREATRFLYLTTFSLVVLAGFGLDYLCTATAQDPFWRVVRQWLNYSIGVCLAVFLLPVFFAKVGGYWQYFSLLLILMSCILLRSAVPDSNLRMSPAFRILLIALVFFDLNGFNWSAVNKIERDQTGHDELEVLNSLKGATDFLKTQPQLFRVKVFRDPQPNIGDAYGVQSVSGAGATLETHFVNIKDNLDLLNTEYFIRPALATELGPVYQDGHWKIYKNPNALPRFWIVHEFKREPNEEEMLRDTQERHSELRQIAFIDDLPLETISSAAPSGNESVRMDLFSEHEIKLTVHAARSGLLVLSELYYPEWHAFVNGRECKILRTDEALRSIAVPAGESEIRFSYWPTTVYLGGVFSVATCIATLTSLVWRGPKRRRFESSLTVSLIRR